MYIRTVVLNEGRVRKKGAMLCLSVLYQMLIDFCHFYTYPYVCTQKEECCLKLILDHARAFISVVKDFNVERSTHRPKLSVLIMQPKAMNRQTFVAHETTSRDGNLI